MEYSNYTPKPIPTKSPLRLIKDSSIGNFCSLIQVPGELKRASMFTTIAKYYRESVAIQDAVKKDLKAGSVVVVDNNKLIEKLARDLDANVISGATPKNDREKIVNELKYGATPVVTNRAMFHELFAGRWDCISTVHWMSVAGMPERVALYVAYHKTPTRFYIYENASPIEAAAVKRSLSNIGINANKSTVETSKNSNEQDRVV